MISDTANAHDDALMPGTFDDAMALVEAVRDHIAASTATAKVEGADSVTPAVRLRAAQELSRLTSRATAAVSLLLLLRALEEGQEVGVDNVPARVTDIYADVRNTGAPTDLPGVAASQAPLPDGLAALLAQADAVFARMPAVHARLRAHLGMDA